MAHGGHIVNRFGGKCSLPVCSEDASLCSHHSPDRVRLINPCWPSVFMGECDVIKISSEYSLKLRKLRMCDTVGLFITREFYSIGLDIEK